MLVEQQWPDVPVTSKSAAPDQIVTAIADRLPAEKCD